MNGAQRRRNKLKGIEIELQIVVQKCLLPMEILNDYAQTTIYAQAEVKENKEFQKNENHLKPKCVILLHFTFYIKIMVKTHRT